MATTNHNIKPESIFHSDRGSNYTSRDFAETLKKHNLRQSAGRTGICFDNAQAESFFAALKVERVHRTKYPNTSTRTGRHRPLYRNPLQYETSPLGIRLPDTTRGPRRVPETTASSVK
ncbi:hypothetical protein E1288_44430 [Saccharopolyspora elongata]|uniref:Integrase catalytic domain-containing protein n=1 Tax=Saccharopolyspora elongata TaxID=2530387 RepID=A0A4V2YID7_9PSEU|nr:hypothetical protein E1288_44430 [Saccharopolyspora elongata]